MPYYPRYSFIDGTGTNAIAAAHTGDTATGSGTNATALGHAATASATDSVALGSGATASTNIQTIAIGGASNISASASALATGTQCIAIGSSGNPAKNGAKAAGTSSTAIGPGDANNNGAQCLGNYSIAIGHNTSVGGTHNNSIAFGAVAATTAANQIMLGTSAETVVCPGGLSIDGVVMSGAWTTWSPVVSQSVTPTATTNYAHYIKIGRLVMAFWKVSFTGAGTAANAILLSGLPFAAAAGTNLGVYGSYRYFQSGTTNHVGTPINASTTSINFVYDAFGNNLGNGDSVTIKSGDALEGFVAYEATT
jgi:hypothetical protein